MINDAILFARTLSKLPSSMDRAEAMEKLSAAHLHILSLVSEIHELKQETIDLRDEIRSLREADAQRANLVHKDGTYWNTRQTPPDGPFCAKCKDNDNKLVRMRIYEHGDDSCHCPVCKQWSRAISY